MEPGTYHREESGFKEEGETSYSFSSATLSTCKRQDPPLPAHRVSFLLPVFTLLRTGIGDTRPAGQARRKENSLTLLVSHPELWLRGPPGGPSCWWRLAAAAGSALVPGSETLVSGVEKSTCGARGQPSSPLSGAAGGLDSVPVTPGRQRRRPEGGPRPVPPKSTRDQGLSARNVLVLFPGSTQKE